MGVGVGVNDGVGDGELDGVGLGVGLTVGVGVFVGVGDGVFIGDGVAVGVCGVGDGVLVLFGACDTIRDTIGDSPPGAFVITGFAETFDFGVAVAPSKSAWTLFTNKGLSLETFPSFDWPLIKTAPKTRTITAMPPVIIVLFRSPRTDISPLYSGYSLATVYKTDLSRFSLCKRSA